jgi:NADH-quinone oxidoreductase subunit G
MSQDGKVIKQLEWHNVPALIEHKLRKWSVKDGRALAAILSPFLTVEEAYLLARYVRSIDPSAWLVLGPVPAQGHDERFPTGFTIRAEKCPNRRGVEKVISGFGGNAIYEFQEFRGEVNGGISLGAVWITGGYPTPWHDDELVTDLFHLALPICMIVQDCLPSPLYEAATIKLPGATFAERSGSYVNATDRLQSFDWAVRPPAGVMVEGRLYWQLLGREGLYRASQVMAEISREISHFSAAAQGVPDVGVDVKVNQLA